MSEPARWTAAQLRAMVVHIEECDQCGDAEIRATLYDESLPPAELAEYIATAHSAEWVAFLAKHAGTEA